MAGRTVELTVSRGNGQTLYSYFGLTGPDGTITLQTPEGQGIPPGVLTITAAVYGAAGDVRDTASLDPRLDEADHRRAAPSR